MTRVRLAVLLASAALALPGRAGAQDVPRDTAVAFRGTIVLIAGADVHIELDAPIRPNPGDTLVVVAADSVRGRLVVIAGDTLRALAGFAAAPFPLTRGERLEGWLRRGSEAAAPGREQPIPPPPLAPGALAAPAVVAGGSGDRPATRRGTVASGYAAAGFRGGTVRGAGGQRGYGVPAATLSLRVHGLPGGLAAQFFGRAEQRSGAWAGTEGTTLDVYTALVEMRPGPFRLAVGRQGSAHDPYGGRWDGLTVEAGRRAGLALSAGWEADRGTGTPSTRHPRIGAAAFASVDATGFRYRGSVSLRRYLDERPAGRPDVSIATRHAVTAGPLLVSGDLLAGRPRDGEPMAVQWGGVTASAALPGGARIHAGYRTYRALVLSGADSAIAGDGRSRVEAGANVAAGRFSAAVNVSTVPGDPERALGASTHLLARRVVADVDLDASAGTWAYGSTRTTQVGAGLARSFGAAWVRAGYRRETDGGPDPAATHELLAEASLGFARRSALTALLTHATGPAATGSHVQLRVSRGF
jgi:hypothetical protein